MVARLIDGKRIAHAIRSEVAAEVSSFAAVTGVTPTLAAVLVGNDPASQVYVRNKERACTQAGIRSVIRRLPDSVSSEQLLQHIHVLNSDTEIHAILVQLPLPPQIDAAVILDNVAAEKDVDGFHPINVGRMLQGRPLFLPCTPHGVMKLLQAEQVPTAGAHAVVIGRSDIVGKPMAAMLLQRGVDATVTVCHSRTRNIDQLTREADILIAAVGIPKFVHAEMIRPGAVVIDVGINRQNDSLVGDVDFQSALQIASAITPVPGGVGPMTIAMLLRNTLEAAVRSADRQSGRPAGRQANDF